MGDELFDLDKVALSPKQIADLAPLQKKSTAKSRKRNGKAKFVMLPYERTLAAAGKLKNATMAVLVELAHRRFKRHQNTVLLANEALTAVGVSRWAKDRALKQLEAVKLVKVYRHKGRSPQVKILF